MTIEQIDKMMSERQKMIAEMETIIETLISLDTEV